MAQELTRWDPFFDDFRPMRRMFGRLPGWATWPGVTREAIELTGVEEMLPVDIYDEGNNLIIKAAIPGVKSEDIDVNVTDDILNINAETKREEEVNEDRYHRREFRYGKMHRSFRLPAGMDASKVDANYENGLLTLTIPRASQAQAKKIEVKGR